MTATNENSKKIRYHSVGFQLPDFQPHQPNHQIDLSRKRLSAKELALLEPIVDRLLIGSPVSKESAKDIAQRLEALGYPSVLDHTEQLRLALRLLECHDDSVGSEKKRRKSARPPETGLA